MRTYTAATNLRSVWYVIGGTAIALLAIPYIVAAVWQWRLIPRGCPIGITWSLHGTAFEQFLDVLSITGGAIVYISVALLLPPCIAIEVRQQVMWRRQRLGLCAHCAYPTCMGDACPECGMTSSRSVPPRLCRRVMTFATVIAAIAALVNATAYLQSRHAPRFSRTVELEHFWNDAVASPVQRRILSSIRLVAYLEYTSNGVGVEYIVVKQIGWPFRWLASFEAVPSNEVDGRFRQAIESRVENVDVHPMMVDEVGPPCRIEVVQWGALRGSAVVWFMIGCAWMCGASAWRARTRE